MGLLTRCSHRQIEQMQVGGADGAAEQQPTLTLLVPKPHVGLVDLVESFCWPELLWGLAVPGPGLFMPNACFSCSLEMNAARHNRATGGWGCQTCVHACWWLRPAPSKQGTGCAQG